jgi:hypothetical protein
VRAARRLKLYLVRPKLCSPIEVLKVDVSEFFGEIAIQRFANRGRALDDFDDVQELIGAGRGANRHAKC